MDSISAIEGFTIHSDFMALDLGGKKKRELSSIWLNFLKHFNVRTLTHALSHLHYSPPIFIHVI